MMRTQTHTWTWSTPTHTLPRNAFNIRMLYTDYGSGCCARIAFRLRSIQASRNLCRGIVNSYGSCSFSHRMFCLLRDIDSSVTPTMVLSSLHKELKPSIATFSSIGNYLQIGPSSKFQEPNPLPL